MQISRSSTDFVILVPGQNGVPALINGFNNLPHGISNLNTDDIIEFSVCVRQTSGAVQSIAHAATGTGNQVGTSIDDVNLNLNIGATYPIGSIVDVRLAVRRR